MAAANKKIILQSLLFFISLYQQTLEMLLVSFFFTETLSYCSRLRVLMAIRPIEFGGMNERLA